MRTFYDMPKSLVIEYIFYHKRIKQQDLADRLCLDPKLVRSYIQEFKRDKIINEGIRVEYNDVTTGRRNQDQYYYELNRDMFINVVRFRLIKMQAHADTLERQQTYKPTNYKCEQCDKVYTELEYLKLYKSPQEPIICSLCEGVVQEEEETAESAAAARQTVTRSLFNMQMKPIFDILEKIDELLRTQQPLDGNTDQDFLQQNGSASSTAGHGANRDGGHAHRSHASTVFDQVATINHDIQIYIDQDEDDHYSPMDIDETSNTDSLIGSSRGPGKPGKRSHKPVQSAAEVASQPVTTKMKLAGRKVPYEPKPLPDWFRRSTIHVDPEEEQRLNHSTLHPAGASSHFSRQLSSSKLTKSNSLSDIKQMLLVHESRRNKTLTLSTMEDSLSPPTPIQMTKSTDPQ